MGKKKTHPKNKPATQQDINKAKRKANDAAISYCWTVMMSVMRDKHGYGVTRLARLWEDVEKLCEEINEGRVSIDDLKKTLKDEANIEIY